MDFIFCLIIKLIIIPTTLQLYCSGEMILHNSDDMISNSMEIKMQFFWCLVHNFQVSA